MKSLISASIVLAVAFTAFPGQILKSQPSDKNFAVVATPSGSVRYETSLNFLNDDLTPNSTEWQGDLLNGVLTIRGKWSDGTPLVAVPNYVLNNRDIIKSTYVPGHDDPGGGSMVWIKSEP